MGILVSFIKWFFTLPQLAWFVAGALSFSAITYVNMKFKRDNTGNKASFTFVVLSALTFAFTILWTYDSYLENEVRAANMGLLVFGGIAVIFALVAHRLKDRNSKKAVSTVETIAAKNA